MLQARYTGCVYLATNTVNGRAYIGKAVAGLATRKIGHRYASKSRRTPFMEAIRKHGWDAFAWAELFLSDDESALLNAEIALIADYRATGVRLYNITPGGEGTAMPCTDERRRKVSASMTGRTLSDEHRRKLSEGRKGVPVSAQTRSKISAAKTGKKLPRWTPERRAKFVASWDAKRASGYRHGSAVNEANRERGRKRAADPTERARLVAMAKLGARARWGRA
jgi:group I intron endonuclease